MRDSFFVFKSIFLNYKNMVWLEINLSNEQRSLQM